MLSGTEADIINCVARLKETTKGQIRRQVGFSLDYIGFLCRYLVRKGYLRFVKGHYSLSKEGIKSLLSQEEPKIDRELLKEIAGGVAKEISDELKKTVKSIKIPVKNIKEKKEIGRQEPVKIKTDFEFPVEDESLILESNINKIGTNLEKEKSNIEKSVKLFKKIQNGRKKK